MIRRAVRLLRERHRQQENGDVASMLTATSGMWRHGDAQDYLDRLRDEW